LCLSRRNGGGEITVEMVACVKIKSLVLYDGG
jgi:hypothetical protein